MELILKYMHFSQMKLLLFLSLENYRYYAHSSLQVWYLPPLYKPLFCIFNCFQKHRTLTNKNIISAIHEAFPF